jgi:hypothetical protein
LIIKYKSRHYRDEMNSDGILYGRERMRWSYGLLLGRFFKRDVWSSSW